MANLEWRLSIQEFIDHYTKNDGHWVAQIDNDEPFLKLFDKNGEQVEVLRFSPIGSYALETETWTWAWANENFNALLTRRANNIRRYGEKYGFDELTIPDRFATEEQVEKYNIITSAVYGGRKPVIWLPTDSKNKLCILIEDDLDLPDVNADTFMDVMDLRKGISRTLYDPIQSVHDYVHLRNATISTNDTDFADITFTDGETLSTELS